MNKDSKVGLIAFLILIAIMIVQGFRHSGLSAFNNRFNLLFTQVHGLRAGDPVTIGGVKAGRVLDIDFAPKNVQDSFFPITGGRILVSAAIDLDSGRKIPKESTYAIRVNLSGHRWLDITLSPSGDNIGSEQYFFAEETSGQDDQLSKTLQTFSTLTAETEGLRNQLMAPDFLLRIKDTASNLRFYSREIMAASNGAAEIVADTDREFDRQEVLLLQRLKEFDEKIQEVSHRMVEMGPQLSENIRGWSQRMERQSERLTSTLSAASLKSEEYQSILDDALKQQLDPEIIRRIVKQTKRWSREIKEYRYLAQDLHTLTSDTAIRADLKKVIRDFRIKSDDLDLKALEFEKSLEKTLKLKDSSPQKTSTKEGSPQK